MESLWSLLEVMQVGGGVGSGGGGGRRGGAPLSPLTSWANKDMDGNSSIARRNRSIFNEQMSDKTRDAYENDLHDRYGKDWEEQAKNAGEDWDSLTSDQQSDLQDQYRPDLSSHERNQLNRAREQAREDAREAVRDIAKETGDKGKPSSNEKTQDNFSRDAAGFGNDAFIDDRARNYERSDPSAGGEEEPGILDQLESTDTEDSDSKPVSMIEFTALKNKVDDHINNHALYYG
ncbi:MAG: hypothetical protein JXR25_11835 [Pontiellaceae bacterium]|nr:hypothetical protein [Pontiellaceae bacterium]